MDLNLFLKAKQKVLESCGKVIRGKNAQIENVLICFLCGGHILLEDVPGTGKTMLLRSFAATVGGQFTRIQFTPDLLPSDLTGINFYNRKTEKFEFHPGPLFSQMILADEINRATPRTQSSLLEAMAEQQITVDGKTYPMQEPFMVMATQNPLESYGTFPLPEAQVDRFFMRLSLGYMDREDELAVISGTPAAETVKEISPVLTREEIDALKAQRREVMVHPDVASYLMDIIAATRTGSKLGTGVSTRGAIALYEASQVKAALNGREYVIPEDIRDLAPAVLAHRTGSGSVTMADAEQYIRKLVSSVKAPLESV